MNDVVISVIVEVDVLSESLYILSCFFPLFLSWVHDIIIKKGRL
jgi:hypothetical protein